MQIHLFFYSFAQWKREFNYETNMQLHVIIWEEVIRVIKAARRNEIFHRCGERHDRFDGSASPLEE